jgi:hypothetical protein
LTDPFGAGGVCINWIPLLASTTTEWLSALGTVPEMLLWPTQLKPVSVVAGAVPGAGHLDDPGTDEVMEIEWPVALSGAAFVGVPNRS